MRPSASQPVSLSVSQTVCQSHSVDCQLEEGKGRLRSQADFLKYFNTFYMFTTSNASLLNFSVVKSLIVSE